MTAPQIAVVDFLLLALLMHRITDLEDQLAGARLSVEQQQTDHTNWRLEYGPRHPRGNQ
ncbi:hypothetical protein [Streptomyces rimosus]|uniref:hypothetical protein n=1 Tax=Streptomyces rimosus TaxID=1927 RepID=UPI000A61C888|nr:hypothetical protein [Streptomyces rimosus]